MKKPESPSVSSLCQFYPLRFSVCSQFSHKEGAAFQELSVQRNEEILGETVEMLTSQVRKKKVFGKVTHRTPATL